MLRSYINARHTLKVFLPSNESTKVTPNMSAYQRVNNHCRYQINDIIFAVDTYMQHYRLKNEDKNGKTSHRLFADSRDEDFFNFSCFESTIDTMLQTLNGLQMNYLECSLMQNALPGARKSHVIWIQTNIRSISQSTFKFIFSLFFRFYLDLKHVHERYCRSYFVSLNKALRLHHMPCESILCLRKLFAHQTTRSTPVQLVQPLHLWIL